jgi:hypothetical protein
VAEYNKKKSEQEAEKVCNQDAQFPYDKIQEALEELEVVSHPNEEQERLWEVLRSTALRAHDGRAYL